MSLVFMYIKEMIGYMIVALPVYIIARYKYMNKKKKYTNGMNEIILGIFVLYVIGLASQTVIPKWNLGIIRDTGEVYFDVHLFNEIARINLIPFATIYNYIVDSNSGVSDWSSIALLNILANMFLFSPLGFFVPLIWSNKDSFKKILYIGFAGSFLIEILQLFIGRSTDIDDVILNTIGVIFGYVLFVFFKKIMNRIRVYKREKTFGQ